MASSSATNITLSDGQTELGPLDPRTWSSDERLRAKWLNTEIGAPIFWHRQRPFFQGLQTVKQTVVSGGVWTEISIDWELKDTAGGHNDPNNVAYWNAPVTAHIGDSGNMYLCIGYVPTGTESTANSVVTGLVVNDGGEYREGTKLAANTGHGITGMVVELLYLTQDDWVTLGAKTSNNSPATVVSGKTPSLSVRWVGAITGYLEDTPPGTPHTWIPADQVTADTAGSSPALGGSKVPLNNEVTKPARYLNFPPYARITSETISQSIPSSTSTWTPINFGWQYVDAYEGWSSSDPSKWFFPHDGVYFVAGYYSTGESSSGNSGYRAVRLQVNGDPNKVYGGTTTDATKATSLGTAIYAVHQIRVKAGDYVQVQAQQNSGSSKPIRTGNADCCRLIVVWESQ